MVVEPGQQVPQEAWVEVGHQAYPWGREEGEGVEPVHSATPVAVVEEQQNSWELISEQNEGCQEVVALPSSEVRTMVYRHYSITMHSGNFITHVQRRLDTRHDTS